eukprot:gene8095-6527_t
MQWKQWEPADGWNGYVVRRVDVPMHRLSLELQRLRREV